MASINNTPAHEEISFSEFAALLRKGKAAISIFVLVCTLAAVVAAFVLPKKYTATVLMSPVAGSSGGGQMGGLGSLVSQIGGLSSLAGISMTEDSKKAESVAVLQSEALTERYIQTNNLLPILYPRKWDSQSHRWNSTDPTKIPTLWKANEYFKKKIRSVTSEGRTGLVTLTVTWTDPRLAAQWANGLVHLTNEYLRAKAIDESERNIAYLNEEAAKMDVVGVKEAIYTILQNEISKEMLARGNDEYAFKILDPAVPAELPSSLHPALLVLMGFLGSIALSLLVVFVRVAWNVR